MCEVHRWWKLLHILREDQLKNFGVVAPLSLVLLPGGDVVSVGVGEACHHHLPPFDACRLGNGLSKSPENEIQLLQLYEAATCQPWW